MRPTRSRPAAAAVRARVLGLVRAALCACSVLMSPAASGVELRVAAQEGTEPKFIVGKDGIVGLCVDILRAIEHIDPGLRFVGDQRWLPQIRSYSEVAGGKQDVLCGVQHTPERDLQFLFLDPPLFPIEYVLIARADDPVAIASWDDVRRLGAQGVVMSSRGYATTTILAGLGGLQVDASATNPLMNLQKLISGRGRFFLHRATGLQATLERAGIAGQVRILPQVMFRTKLHMVVGRHVDAAVVTRLQHAIAALEKSGELERLLKKWD
jgi:ABC-type amino acid transport substrate-binding protein